MAVSLERVDRHDGNVDPQATQRNFDTLASLVPGTGGRSIEIRYGTASISFPGGSATTSATTVSHGLGRAPVVVVATVTDTAATRFTVLATNTYTSTTFSLQGQVNDTSSPGAGTTLGVSWIAIG